MIAASQPRREPLPAALDRFDCLTAGRSAHLDGMRGLLCLGVLYTHFGGFILEHPFRFGEAGRHAVWGFFSLSGVLIMRLLLKSRAAVANGRLARGAAWTSFNVRRARRLWPLYAIILIAGLATDMIGVRNLWASFATMTMNYPLAVRYLWGKCALAHFWSLAVEEHFYLLAAPLVLFARARLMAAVAAVFMVCAVAWRWVVISQIGDMELACRISHGCMDLPLAGCLTAWAYTPSAPLWFKRTLQGLGVTGLAYWTLEAGTFVWVNPAFHAPYFALLPTMVAFSMAFLLMLLWARPVPVLGGLFSFPPLRWLGARCYGIYAWHFALLWWVPWSIGLMEWEVSRVAMAGIVITFTLVLAGLSWKFIEQPLMRAKSR